MSSGSQGFRIWGGNREIWEVYWAGTSFGAELTAGLEPKRNRWAGTWFKGGASGG